MLRKQLDGTWKPDSAPASVPDFDCAHKWYSILFGPVDCFAKTNPQPPSYKYKCKICAKEIKSRIKLNEKICEHEMVKAVELGPNYDAEYCTKCKFQIIK